MEIELKGRKYEARADFAAIMDAEESEGLRLEDFGQGGTTEFLKWLFYFIRRGEEYVGRKFEMTLREFSGMLEMSDVDELATAIGRMMSTGDPAEAKTTQKKKG